MTVSLPPVQVYERYDHFLSGRLERKKSKIVFWTPKELNILQKMQNAGKTYHEIGQVLGRTESAVAQKVAKILHDYDIQDFTLNQVKNGKTKTK